MLPEHSDRARLRPLLTHLFGKRYANSNAQAGKAGIEHAVAVKIDFSAIRRFEKAEFAGRVEPRHPGHGFTFVLLHLPLQEASMVLQPPACSPECIVDGKLYYKSE